MSELGPTQRFSTRVDDYARARPRYPDQVVDLLARETELTPGGVIADVGAGTGLSAEPFLRRGYTVLCVEPNDAMRAAAEQWLGQYPGFRSIAGTAEQTTLPTLSVDCVIAAQAFHWFDAAAARAEFARIARGGLFVLMWHNRRTSGSPFLLAYEALLHEFGTDYAQVRDRTESVLTPAELRRFSDGAYSRHVLQTHQELDLAALKSRVTSASYMPAEGSPAFGPMMAAVTQLFAAESQSGHVRLEYDLEIYIGRVRTHDSA